MRRQSRCARVVAAAGAALPFIVAGLAEADISATVVVTRRDLNAANTESAVPGLPAATMALASANGVRPTWVSTTLATNAGFSTVRPMVDANGTVYFIGTAATLSYNDPNNGGALTFLLGTAAGGANNNGNSNNRMIFSSTAASGYAFNSIGIAARDGSTSSPTTALSGSGESGAILGGMSAPLNGVASGNVLNGTNNLGGMSSSMSVSSNGTTLFTSLVAPVSGTTVGASWFTGNSTGYTQAVNNGGTANGSGGGTFSISAATNLVNGGVAVPVNNSGQVGVVGTLATGGSINATNNAGLWRCGPTGNVKVFQRGDAAAGTTGSVAGNYALGVAIDDQQRVQINSTGGILFTNTLASTNLPVGFVVPDTTQRQTLWYAPSASSPQLLAQSGTSVGAAYPGAVYANSSVFLGGFPGNVSPQMLNNSGTVVYNTKFNPNSGTNASTASITANVNDQAIMKWNGGVTSMLFHTGDTPVPGVAGATFQDLTFSNPQTRLNNLGHYTLAATMTNGGAITTTNDGGLWLGNGSVGGASLIAREGDAVPGMAGLVFGGTFSNVMMNNADMIVFQNTPTNGVGGSAGATTIFAYGPTFGLVNLFSVGNTALLGANFPVTLFSFNLSSNGDGGVQGLNDNGVLTFQATSTGVGGAFAGEANAAIMVTQIPAPGVGALAMLGLAAAARRRR